MGLNFAASTTNRLDCGTNVPTSTNRTFVCWINPNAANTANRAILEFSDASAAAEHAYLSFGSGGTNFVQWGFQSTLNNYLTATWTSGFTAGTWHLLVCTYDGATLKIYADSDATPKATLSTSEIPTTTAGEIFMIGNVPFSSNNRPADCIIGECAWFTSVLGSTDIASLASGVSPQNLTVTPAAYWRMKGANYASNVIGNLSTGNTGTITGASVSTHPTITYASPDVPFVFFAPVRGPSTTGLTNLTGVFNNITGIHTDAAAVSVSVTWLARWDALTDNTNYGPALDSYRLAGDEIGLWMEIIPDWCTAASVTYNSNGTNDFGACRCTLLGYSQANRRALIDTTMAAYHSRWSAYPKTVGMWMLDAYSIQYMRDNYGVTSAWQCRDQWNTDAYELQGSVADLHTVYEPAANWTMEPAQGSDRMGIATGPLMGVEIINNYGYTSSAPPTLEPVAIQQASNDIPSSWIPLCQEIVNHPGRTGATAGFVSALMENGWTFATYATTVQNMFRAAADLAADQQFNLKTASQVATAFLGQSNSVRDRIRFSRAVIDPYAYAAPRAVEVASPYYRGRFRYFTDASAGYMALTDLRIYGPNATDPYYNTVLNAEQGVWRAPWGNDAARYTVIGTSTGQADIPPNLPVHVGMVFYDPSPGFQDDFGYPTGIPIGVTASPDLNDGTPLSWTRTASSTGSIAWHQKGIVWTMTRPAVSTSSIVYLGHGVSALADPLTEYIWQGGSETSFSANDNTNTVTEYFTGVQYLALVWDNRDAAVIYFPMSKGSNQTYYGATAKGNACRFGVNSTDGTTALNAAIAVVPCTKTNWRSVLAALQANALNYLDGVNADGSGAASFTITCAGGGTRLASGTGSNSFAFVAAATGTTAANADGSGSASFNLNCAANSSRIANANGIASFGIFLSGSSVSTTPFGADGLTYQRWQLERTADGSGYSAIQLEIDGRGSSKESPRPRIRKTRITDLSEDDLQARSVIADILGLSIEDIPK